MKNALSILKATMDKAMDNGLYTTNLLKEHTFFDDIYIAINDVFTFIVNYNTRSVECVRKYTGYEKEDFILELSYKVMSNFATLANYYIKQGGKINYNSYLTNAFRNFICDILYKFQIKTYITIVDGNGNIHSKLVPLRKKDENGYERIVYFDLVSLSCPLSEDADSDTLESVIPSNSKTPEQILMNKDHLKAFIEYCINTVSERKNKLNIIAAIYLIKLHTASNTNIEDYAYLTTQIQKTLKNNDFLIWYNKYVSDFLNTTNIIINKSISTDNMADFSNLKEEYGYDSIYNKLIRATYIAKQDIIKNYNKFL